jgi:membrane-associated phospholipid phosphatase
LNKANYTYSPNPCFDKFIHLSRSYFFFISVIVFCIISYFFIDQPLALYLKHNLNQRIVNVSEFITHFGKGTAYYIAFPLLFLFFKFIVKRQIWANASGFMFLAILTPGLLCTLLKVILGRTRPILLFSENLYGFTFFKFDAAHLSFPSGHSTLITSVMIGLCFILPRFWNYFFALFIIISLSRVLVCAHYISDIVAGMYLSIFMVPWVYKKLPERFRPPALSTA